MPENIQAPPKFALKLIRLWCRDSLYEEIEGNLYEFYAENMNAKNLRSKLRFWFEVVNYLRPSTFKSFQNLNTNIMFSFNPKLTVRNLWLHRSATLINLCGFILGLVSVFYLFFYVQSELKYDSFHENGKNIYRTLRVGNFNESQYHIGVTSGPYAEALKTDFPQIIQETCRAYPQNGLVSYKDKVFFEEKILFADNNFFQFFSYPLNVGNAKTVLSSPNSMVISPGIAYKYFGDEDPVGKIIRFDDEIDFTVTGVLGEFYEKSHLDFNIVLSMDVLEGYNWFQDWWSNGLITYVQIDTPEGAAKMDSQLQGFMNKYFGEDFKESGNTMGLVLQPLSDIYFDTTVRYDRVLHGNVNTIYILIAVAVAILFIAAFNYINLSIAQSFRRAKEVGVRKVMGGGNLRLVIQFLGEVCVILTASMGIAVIITQFFTPILNSYFDLDVSIIWNDGSVIVFLLSLFGATLIISGVYPALQLTGFKPLKTLSGNIGLSGNSTLRKGLVVGQFVISIFLIAVTLLISRQLDFIRSADLGFNEESIILVDLNNSDIRENLESFKAELLANSNVNSVTAISGEPGGFHDMSTFIIEGVDENMRMKTLFTDTSYLSTFQIELSSGRNFVETENLTENGGMLLNETALRELGLDFNELIGRRVQMPLWDVERQIVGVVHDFHFVSLHDKTEPLMIIQGGGGRRLAIKTASGDLQSTVSFINDTYSKYSPTYPLSYEFLDESLNDLYEDERKQAEVFTVFSGISILLACLGVLGLTSFAARRRQKEFGIRKVLGASISNIIGLISKEFLILITLATVVAAPIIIYFMSDWLLGFAYRIEISDHWPIFVISGLCAATVAWLSIWFITYKSAITKPTESIRYE